MFLVKDAICITTKPIDPEYFNCMNLRNRSICYNVTNMQTFDQAVALCNSLGASIPYVKTETDQLILLDIMNLKEYKGVIMDIWIQVDQGKSTIRTWKATF